MGPCKLTSNSIKDLNFFFDIFAKIRTREPGPVLGNLDLNRSLVGDGQFARSHGSYNPNLGSEIVILGGDIRSRSWPNIGGTYGK